MTKYGAPNHISYDNTHTEQREAFIQIIIKYNIYSITNTTHHHHHNPVNYCIWVNKNGRNNPLNQTSAPIFVWVYVLLL